MDLPVSNPVEPYAAAGGGAKFAFASGSQPLAGYTIKRGIGRGGFGEVYYAVSDAGKEVALKLIRRNLEIELRGVTQCLNLKHPNLLAIYDIKRDAQDDAWVVMEYVNGDSLEDVLERCPNGMPLAEAQQWLRGILAAVAYLHDHGIVHRDLKPGNIFSDDGVVKLGDYGLSKFISCSRRSGQTESVGTVHYMAPEIANGRYGKEIDIYALGIIVCEMLTGKVPFEGESIGEVLMKHLTKDPDLRQLSEPYRSAVAAALVKDPAQRITSATELARRMGLALPGDAMTAGHHAATAGVLSSMPPPPPGAPPTAAATDTNFANYPIIEPANPGAGRGALPPNSPPPLPNHASDEPILRAVKDAARQLRSAWRAAGFGTPAKILIVLVALLVLIPTAGIWAIVGLSVGAAYVVYRLVRGFVMMHANPERIYPAAMPPPPPPASARPIPPPPPTARPAKRSSRRDRWQRDTACLPRGSVRERFTELCGSLLVATVVAALGAIVLITLRQSAPTPSQFVWLTAVGTLGAWAVLIPCKIWEGPTGEPLLRRLVMFVMGLLIGCAAYGVQRFLEMGPESLPYGTGYGHINLIHNGSQLFVEGMPGLMANMLYFGFVMLIPRWWVQTEWFRPARLAVWPIVVCVFWAWLLHSFWPFPQPWGMLATGLIALAIQLSSPWPNPNVTRRPA